MILGQGGQSLPVYGSERIQDTFAESTACPVGSDHTCSAELHGW